MRATREGQPSISMERPVCVSQNSEAASLNTKCRTPLIEREPVETPGERARENWTLGSPAASSSHVSEPASDHRSAGTPLAGHCEMVQLLGRGSLSAVDCFVALRLIRAAPQVMLESCPARGVAYAERVIHRNLKPQNNCYTRPISFSSMDRILVVSLPPGV